MSKSLYLGLMAGGSWLFLCPSGGIGRRTGLKIRWGVKSLWEFESPLGQFTVLFLSNPVSAKILGGSAQAFAPEDASVLWRSGGQVWPRAFFIKFLY